MDIRLHKSIDIRIKDISSFQDAEDAVDQVLESLRAEIIEEVKDVIIEEADSC